MSPNQRGDLEAVTAIIAAHTVAARILGGSAQCASE
jgi:hypothetical protein